MGLDFPKPPELGNPISRQLGFCNVTLTEQPAESRVRLEATLA